MIIIIVFSVSGFGIRGGFCPDPDANMLSKMDLFDMFYIKGLGWEYAKKKPIKEQSNPSLQTGQCRQLFQRKFSHQKLGYILNGRNRGPAKETEARFST
jgi:hypothetical protein